MVARNLPELEQLVEMLIEMLSDLMGMVLLIRMSILRHMLSTCTFRSYVESLIPFQQDSQHGTCGQLLCEYPVALLYFSSIASSRGRHNPRCRPRHVVVFE